MILSQFAGHVSGQSPAPEHHTQTSRARGWGGKMAQKGVFNNVSSYARGSMSLFQRLELCKKSKEVEVRSQRDRKAVCDEDRVFEALSRDQTAAQIQAILR